MNRHASACAEHDQQDQQDRLGLDGLEVDPSPSSGTTPTTAMTT